ncbi:MAG: tetratricopeptide repeat protein [Asgard group archaeon]|nr:tetratricopeptide repeat protein [Asgard group archaeon]
MSSPSQKQLEDVKQLIDHGNFKEAFTIIEKVTKKKNITKNEKLSFLVQKSAALNLLGKLQESLVITESILKEVDKEDSLIHLDALLEKSYSLARTRKIEDTFATLEKIEDVFKQIKNLSETIVAYRKAILMRTKWWLFFVIGEREKFMQYAREFNEYSKKSKNKHLIALSCHVLAFLHAQDEEDHELSEAYLDESYEIGIELDNDYLLTGYYNWSGNLHRTKMNYRQAIEVYQKGIELAEKNEFDIQLPVLYLYKGGSHLPLLELDTALELYMKVLEYPSAFSFQMYTLTSIGEVYCLKGELELALEYYIRSLNICKEINEQRHQPYLLSMLIELYIELNDLQEAQNYLDELKPFSKTSEENHQRYLYRKGLVLKASKNIHDLSKASVIFEDLLKKEDLMFDLSSLFQLTLIRLMELQVTPNQKTLENVKENIEKLQKLAEERQHNYFLIEIYRLKSQLALIELKVEKALELLITAKTLAEEKGSTLQAQGIAKEQAQLKEQLSMWQQLQKENSSLVETIKQVPLENSIKRITRDTLIESRDEKTGKIIEYRKLFSLKI